MSKFSYILLGLVATFSSFVLFTVHLGTTQAFVSAQTSIDMDLGNGFPGTELTDSFTINFVGLDTTEYTVTLVSAVGVEDIRPYLTVWKPVNASDPDSDGSISGAPDYTGTGSLTQDTDTQDTWLVTFSIPGEKVNPDLGLDYGCQIVIEPLEGLEIEMDGDGS